MAEEELKMTDVLLELSQMFPDIPFAHLQYILDISDNNFNAAVDHMFNYDFIRNDLDEIIKKNIVKKAGDVPFLAEEKDLKVIDSPKYKHNGDGIRRKCFEEALKAQHNKVADEHIAMLKTESLVEKWKLLELIIEILEIQDAPFSLVEWYLIQNKYDKLESIYDILMNFDTNLPPEKQSRDVLEKLSVNEIYMRNSSFADNSVPMSVILKLDTKNTYVSEKEQCWKEMQEIIDSNPELNPPKKFLLLAINWFDKDIPKILNLVLNLNDCFEIKTTKGKQLEKKIESLYKLQNVSISNSASENDFPFLGECGEINGTDTLDMESSNPSSSLDLLQLKSQNLKNAINMTTNKSLIAYYSESISKTKRDIRYHHENSQFRDVEQRIKEAKRTFHIDFHNLSVQNAVYALEEIVNYWWDTELRDRTLRNSKYGHTTALHVLPLVIVTGRGLHSGGGIPKIKNATVNYLTANGFKFEEDISRITVCGKRK